VINKSAQQPNTTRHMDAVSFLALVIA